MSNVSSTALEIIKRMQQNELTESVIYEKIARFAKGNVPAIAEKAFDGWKSVIVGSAGGLTPQYFNRAVREAKGYVPVEGGLQVNMNGRFLSVHCLKPGKYGFRLPFRCRVRNLKSGETSPASSTLPLDLTAGDTCWFMLLD